MCLCAQGIIKESGDWFSVIPDSTPGTVFLSLDCGHTPAVEARLQSLAFRALGYRAPSLFS